MPSSRREVLSLNDMVEAADTIAAFILGTDREAFSGNDLLCSAVLHKLQVIGEAAVHIGGETRRRSPQIPWREIVGFRNYTVHTYFSVDWDIVWTAATDDAPAISAAVRDLIATMEGWP